MVDKKFVIKSINNADYIKELDSIGFDKSYQNKYKEKCRFKNLKIYDLTISQANILKQLALSVGADCATNKNVIVGNVEKSDVILSGSVSQMFKISDKLKHQPFSLSVLSSNILEQLAEKKDRTKIVGILNVTSNSFSDGGMYNTLESACEHLEQLIQDGADIVDIGAESTKPGAESVDDKEQLDKIIPILEYINKNNISVPISIDTRSSKVAEECLKSGARIINDVSGLKYDDKMAEVVAKYAATLVLQHSKGREVNMSDSLEYDNLIDDVYKDLYTQVQLAKNSGIKNIIIDPGIGFDKKLEDNFKIINRIDDFYSMGLPVMVGVSRKSLLNLQNSPNEEKDIYTLAINSILIAHRLDYIRVHNVKLHRKLLDIYRFDN